jgi:flagellar biosynthesis protein FlhF
MRIKSYFAGSIEEAMEKARRELGPDAMLMNSKKTEIELRSLGAYEVVFALPPEVLRSQEIELARSSPSAVLPACPSPESQGSSDLQRELAELRKQIETVKRSVDRRPQTVATTLSSAQVSTVCRDASDIVSRLMGDDFSEVFALEIAAAVEGDLNRKVSAKLEPNDAIVAEFARRIQLKPNLGAAVSDARVVFLIGGPAVGKTTTLAKLALRHRLHAKLPVQLLSLDTLRIGGWEQLASYARIAGLPFDALHTPAALDQAFAEHRHNKLLLIDTPALGSVVEPPSRSFAAWLTEHRSSVEVHLVLSAAVQTRINLSAIERSKMFAPTKLIFTHMDEAETPGPVLESASRAGLPVSFLANGQQVPEDLEEASLERMLGSLCSAETGNRRNASAA